MTATQGLLSRSIAFVFLLVLLMPAAQAKQMVSVDRDEINMRAGPGTGHQSQWMLSRGYPLMVVARKGQWLKVRDFESDEGWVFGPLTGRDPYFVVKAQGSVNIRSEPGTSHPVVGRAQHGEVLRTLAHRGGWVQVEQRGGPKGWVLRKLLWGW